jgi:hypothetical protein
MVTSRTGVAERAQPLCDRSGELAALVGPDDVRNVAIDFLRAGDHDSDRRGALLEAVVAFLGVKPRADEFGSNGVQQ